MSKEKEIDFKIGTKGEALWTKFLNARKDSLKSLEESLIIEKALIALAEEKVKAEGRE